MTGPTSPRADQVWAAIDREKHFDRFLRRVSIAAWSVTILLAILLTIFTGLSVAEFIKGALAGNLPWMTVMGAILPFVTVLGGFSVLVATVCTIGVFLRLRTASLHDIQLRLAALEEMLAKSGDG